jgi:hypothetical protein
MLCIVTGLRVYVLCCESGKYTCWVLWQGYVCMLCIVTGLRVYMLCIVTGLRVYVLCCESGK